MEMIDIHCHIIPGVDDGSKDLNNSIRMAKEASKLGYTRIFATPHYISYDLETSKEDLEKRLLILNKVIKDNNIDIELYSGNEVYISEDIVKQIENEKIYTLGNSKYILIELPMFGKLNNIEAIIDELIYKGYVPIIAHPERYEFVSKDQQELIDLMNIGVLFQINIGSIVGVYGKEAQKRVVKLLKNNMVHFIATDSHNSKTIYSIHEKANKKIKKIITKEKYEEIMYLNPMKIKKDMVLNI